MRRRRDVPEERLEAALAELARRTPTLPDADLGEMARVATSTPVPRHRTTPARSPLSRLPALAAAALAAAAVASLPAWLVLRDGAVRSPSLDEAGAGIWGSNDVVPGRPVAADPLLGGAVRASGVVPARVGQVLAAGTGRERVALVAAAGPGRVCYTVKAGRFVGDFLCPRRLDPEVLIQFSVAGSGAGRGLRLLGVARSDVTRVVLDLADGTRRVLRLNRWRAFSYSAGSGAGSVRLLSAYGPGDALLARIAFRGSTWVRLCGATADPCALRPDTPALLAPEPGLVL